MIVLLGNVCLGVLGIILVSLAGIKISNRIYQAPHQREWAYFWSGLCEVSLIAFIPLIAVYFLYNLYLL